MAATASPRHLKPKGSVDWCWQVVEVLKICYGRLESNWREVETYLRDVEEVAAWKTIPPGRPYGTLEALLRAELGVEGFSFAMI